jgi:hypothetical protein
MPEQKLKACLSAEVWGKTPTVAVRVEYKAAFNSMYFGHSPKLTQFASFSMLLIFSRQTKK